MQYGGPLKDIVAKIQREQRTFLHAQRFNRLGISLRFAADDKVVREVVQPCEGSGGISDAVVDPEFYPGRNLCDCIDSDVVGRASFDRIKIGNVEFSKWS